MNGRVVVDGRRAINWKYDTARAGLGSGWRNVPISQDLDLVSALPPVSESSLVAPASVRAQVASPGAQEGVFSVAHTHQDGKWLIEQAGGGSKRRLRWSTRQSGAAVWGIVSAQHEESGLAVDVIANEESLRRKLFRMILLAPLLESRGLAVLHGAAAVRGEHCVLMTGSAGAGKSTLTLALAGAGWAVLAEDTVFVTPGLEVLPIFLSGRWQCRVRPPDLAVIKSLTAGEAIRRIRPDQAVDSRGRITWNAAEVAVTKVPRSPDLLLFLDPAEPFSIGRETERIADEVRRQLTLRFILGLVGLDYAHVEDQSRAVTRQLTERLSIVTFSPTSMLDEDLKVFFSILP